MRLCRLSSYFLRLTEQCRLSFLILYPVFSKKPLLLPLLLYLQNQFVFAIPETHSQTGEPVMALFGKARAVYNRGKKNNNERHDEECAGSHNQRLYWKAAGHQQS